MRFSDLLAMCRKSLFSRKTRTALTVTGVVIGVCSILLMVSLCAEGRQIFKPLALILLPVTGSYEDKDSSDL